jgi:hypothetical protein
MLQFSMLCGKAQLYTQCREAGNATMVCQERTGEPNSDMVSWECTNKPYSDTEHILLI